MISRTTSAAFAGIGLCLVIPGLQLAFLGGSFAYALIGAVYLLSALLLWRRDGQVFRLFGALVVLVLAWSLSEAGLAWWLLMPRGGLIVLSGLWLLTPWIRRECAEVGLTQGRRAISPRYTGAPLALAILIGVCSFFLDPFDRAGRIDLGPDAAVGGPVDVDAGDWPHYGRTLSGQRYSPLAQITPANIGALKEIWRIRTGDIKRRTEKVASTYQATPLKIGDRLYLCTPHSIAIALDAATGGEVWRFDAVEKLAAGRQSQTCRGVSYHRTESEPGTCAAKIFYTAAGAKLIALDAETGAPCADFGKGGALDLLVGLPHAETKFYYNTSPPVVLGDRVIVGGAVSDSAGLNAPSGVIRAFDAKSGALLWNWDSGNPEATAPLAPGQLYTAGSPNSWSISSADAELGLIYVPMGNQPPDQMGDRRSADVEKFSSSVVALEAATGKVRWVRQFVHHDLWDMDVPAQPSLFSWTSPEGQKIPALAVPTKQGDIYVLDRRTGAPLLPVVEEPAPQRGARGERLAPTQPASALSFAPEPLREQDMWGLTLFDQLACRIRFHRLFYQGRYTPPTVEGSLVHPGNFGVFNWGSIAVDPERQMLFSMPTYLAYVSRLVPVEAAKEKTPPKRMKSVLIKNDGLRYSVRLGPFFGPLGIPCQAPPWGYVAAADLRTGRTVYKHVNGTVRDLGLLRVPLKLGVPGIGGPILTRGGVAFLGGSIDNYLRGYDAASGEEIWRARLPAGGQATPMTYLDKTGRQIVVIVAGGHAAIGTTPGDYVIAYALDQPPQ